MRIEEQHSTSRMLAWLFGFVLLVNWGSATGHAQEAGAEEPADASNAEPEPEGAKADPIARPVPEIVQANPEASDAEIQSRLQEILKATEWYEEVSVRVNHGIVFLNGRTADAVHKTWATGVAENTQDVVAVVNRMKVEAAFDFSNSWGIVRESLEALWQDFLNRLPLLLVGLFVLLITWVVVRIANSIALQLLTKSRVRSNLRDLFLQLTMIGVWLAGITIAAIVVFPGMTPAKLLTVLGLGSVAIGFAFKDIFENFFAGVLILWRFPFDKGDFIECGELLGRVEDITVRNTLIRKVNGELVVVPNAFLFKNPVSVLTNWKSRRVTIICGVAYSEDVDQSREAIAHAVQSCQTVHKDRDLEIFAQEFGDSSINFEVTWWTGNTPKDIRQSKDEVVAAVKRKLDDLDIEIPFPYRTLLFKQPLPVRELVEKES